MTPVREATKRGAKGVVVDFPPQASSDDVRALVGELSRTNELLAELAGHANETLTFVKKFFKVYLPYVVAGLAVAYPTIGKIINGLPPLPR